MDIHPATLVGKVLIPAENVEQAKVILEKLAESMDIALQGTMKSENCCGLAGSITAGTIYGLPIVMTSLERLTRQTELSV